MASDKINDRAARRYEPANPDLSLIFFQVNGIYWAWLCRLDTHSNSATWRGLSPALRSRHQAFMVHFAANPSIFSALIRPPSNNSK